MGCRGLRNMQKPLALCAERGAGSGRGLSEGALGVYGQAPHVAETHFLGTASLDTLKRNRPAADGWRSRVAEDRSQTMPRRASSRSFETNPSRLSTPKRIEVTAIRIRAETATNSTVASIRCTPISMLPGAEEW